MARLFIVPILLALLPEGILAFAMVAGIVWLGNVIYGFILLFAALLLMALPLIGDLVIDVDWAPPRVSVKAGWWGRVAFRGGEPAEVRIRLLGIPYRRRMAKKPPAPKREKKPKVDGKRWALANKADLSRALLAGLQAGNEFLWESEAMAVTVNAPTQIDIVDQIIAGIVGHRTIGPLDLEAKPEGERHGRFSYRIGLAQVFFVGLFVALQGRPLTLMRSYRRASKRAEVTGALVAAPAAGGEPRAEPEAPEADRARRRAA